MQTGVFSATEAPHREQGRSVFARRFGAGGTESMEPSIRMTPVSVTSFASTAAEGLKVNANTNSTSHRGHLTVLPTRLALPRTLCPEGHAAVTFWFVVCNITIVPYVLCNFVH